MSNRNDGPEINANNLVQRRLKLRVRDAGIERLVADIEQLPGVVRVSWRADKALLHCGYDVTRCSLDTVEAAVQNRGAAFADSRWERIKRSYYRFVDQNMRDNAAHEPHCCNKVPRR